MKAKPKVVRTRSVIRNPKFVVNRYSKLEAVAVAANNVLRCLKAAYGNYYPGEMHELVELDEALKRLSL